jgi:predicted transcriptional regulator
LELIIANNNIETMRHRSKIEIIADILRSIMNDSTLSSSKVMYKSFLTYKQMREYLPFLLQNELIKYGDKDRTFAITNKGSHSLRSINRCQNF